LISPPKAGNQEGWKEEIERKGVTMIGLTGNGVRLCDGVNRREFLRIGSLGAAGLGLPDLLRARRAESGKRRARARSCILLFMWGGPAQQETFDLKPDAPEGLRGEFKPIATRVPGIHICEHLPMMAQKVDQYAILRSVTHTGTNHGTSAYHMLTGRIHPSPGTLRHPAPTDIPNIGCAAARFGRQPEGLPAHVQLPDEIRDGDGGLVPGQGAGILGQRHAPFLVQGDPTRDDFSLSTLVLPPDLPPARFGHRIDLQAALERHSGSVTRSAPSQDMAIHYEQAFRLLQSPAAQRAFQLAAEPARVRERYGMHPFGQSCLLARRLVEAGVPLVSVYWNSPRLTDNESWDTHADAFNRMKQYLLPAFDRSMTALLEDLSARGLLDETLIVWKGEFGRTPKINKNVGRDHWGFCQSVLMAGAGVRGGIVHGSSDAAAAYAAELPVSPDDLAATVFDRLGIPLDHEMHDAQNRPYPLCTGKPVEGIF
jgi:hypothetical protein